MVPEGASGTLLDKQLDRGEYVTALKGDTWGLRPGMYFVHFMVDDKLYVKKIEQIDSDYY